MQTAAQGDRIMSVNKRDIIIIITVAVLAAALFLILRGGGQDVAVIYVKNQEYARIPLDEPQTVTVEQDGCVNVIEIFPRGVRMKSSTCKNQLCVEQGDLSADNMLKNDLGGFIICLPNGVSVTIEASE